MNELLVIGNPRRRRKTKAGGHRRRRMSALQRQYFGGGRRRARRNPVAALAALGNPRRRRRRSRSRGGFARRVSRGARRLSFQRVFASPFATLRPALTGALGATLVNTVLARIPLPAMLMTGRTRYLTQGAAAIALGALAQNLRVVGAGTAAKMAEGALTVTLHQAIQDFAAQAGVNLGGMGYYLPGYSAGAAVPGSPGNAARMAGNMGLYVSGPGSGSVIPMRRTNMGNISSSFKF
jgi:hypothetical protein